MSQGVSYARHCIGRSLPTTRLWAGEVLIYQTPAARDASNAAGKAKPALIIARMGTRLPPSW